MWGEVCRGARAATGETVGAALERLEIWLSLSAQLCSLSSALSALLSQPCSLSSALSALLSQLWG